MKKLSIIVAVAMLLTTLCLPVAAADRYVEDIYDTAKFLITFDNENGLVDEKGTYTVNDINGVEIIEGVNGNAMKAQASNYDEATDTYTPKDTYLEVENML
ncbi:MAG: hypothetical protein IJC62_00440, partial [Clostridia bacterium]|nr:hypothetical protein [Clostridia bacterium]